MSEVHEVTAEFPGTFYTRESPTSDPVRLRRRHGRGRRHVGLIEVMKMFNPVASEVAGTVVEICVEPRTPVDVGDVLIRIEEA